LREKKGGRAKSEGAILFGLKTGGKGRKRKKARDNKVYISQSLNSYERNLADSVGKEGGKGRGYLKGGVNSKRTEGS